MPVSDYTAANIHVATDEEILQRWDWARVGHWAHVYCVPEDWLKRAVEACRRAGVEPEYIERRYLQRDGYLEPFRPEVDAAMRELRDEQLHQQK
jgi:hypothetical protein